MEYNEKEEQRRDRWNEVKDSKIQENECRKVLIKQK